MSPQGQQSRPLSLQQPGLPVPGFEANLVSDLWNCTTEYAYLINSSKLIEIQIRTQHSDIGGFSLLRNQSPPPAHQQASPITPVNLVIYRCARYIRHSFLKQTLFVEEFYVQFVCVLSLLRYSFTNNLIDAFCLLF